MKRFIVFGMAILAFIIGITALLIIYADKNTDLPTTPNISKEFVISHLIKVTNRKISYSFVVDFPYDTPMTHAKALKAHSVFVVGDLIDLNLKLADKIFYEDLIYVSFKNGKNSNERISFYFYTNAPTIQALKKRNTQTIKFVVSNISQHAEAHNQDNWYNWKQFYDVHLLFQQ